VQAVSRSLSFAASRLPSPGRLTRSCAPAFFTLDFILSGNSMKSPAGSFRALTTTVPVARVFLGVEGVLHRGLVPLRVDQRGLDLLLDLALLDRADAQARLRPV